MFQGVFVTKVGRATGEEAYSVAILFKKARRRHRTNTLMPFRRNRRQASSTEVWNPDR